MCTHYRTEDPSIARKLLRKHIGHYCSREGMRLIKFNQYKHLLKGTLHRKMKLSSNESVPVVNITRRILESISASLVRSSFVKLRFRSHFLPLPPLWCDVTGVKVDFTAIVPYIKIECNSPCYLLNNCIYVVRTTSLVLQLV